MARRVKPGEEFEAEAHLERVEDASTRKFVVRIVVATGVFFLVGAAIYGLSGNDFGKLNAVWNAVGPIYGGIAGYLFAKKGPGVR